MNIKQAVELSAIRQEGSTKKPSRRLSAVAVAKRVFQLAASGGHPFKGITAEQWAKKWLASDEFVLTEIQATKVALPLVPQDQNLVLRNMAAAADSVEPIVVDINKRHIGASPSGFLPKVIVVDGKHRHKAATMQGRMKLQAWVGVQAAGYLGIQADHDFSSNELSQKIGEALREKFAPKKKNKNADAGMASSLPYPWVQETYPFESYFIYQYEGKFFKQAYEENDKDRTIKLTGEPEVVIQKYTPIKAAAVKYTKLDIAAAVTVIPSQDKAENGSAPHGRMPGVKGDKLYTGAGGVGGSLGNGSGPTPPMKAGQAAPGAGVGPRLPQNKGAKKSELQDMKFDVTKVNKIVTDRNAALEAGGPGSGCNPSAGKCGRHAIAHGFLGTLTVKEAGDALKGMGYTPVGKSNDKWKHADGSRARITNKGRFNSFVVRMNAPLAHHNELRDAAGMPKWSKADAVDHEKYPR